MPFLPKGWEIIVILIVILIIFGPKNLPKLGKAIGKTMSNLRDGMAEGRKKDKAAGDEPAADGGAADEGEPESAPVVAELEKAVDVADPPEEPEPEPEEAGGSEHEEPETETPEPAEPRKVRRVVKKKSPTSE